MSNSLMLVPYAGVSLPEGTESDVSAGNGTVPFDQLVQDSPAEEALSSTLGAVVPVFVIATSVSTTLDPSAEPGAVSISPPQMFAEQNDYALRNESFDGNSFENTPDDDPQPYLPDDEFDRDWPFNNFDSSLLVDLLTV